MENYKLATLWTKASLQSCFEKLATFIERSYLTLRKDTNGISKYVNRMIEPNFF